MSGVLGLGQGGIAHFDTMWSASRGNPASVNPRRILSYDTTADHLLERGEGEQPPRMHRAHLERLRNQQRTAGHGHADHTPGSGHEALRTSRSRVGWASNVDLVQIDAPLTAPTLPPHVHCSGHGASKVLSGTGSLGRPANYVLRPRLASGLLRVPFRLVLEKGAAWRLPAAVIPRARSRAWQSGRPVPSTDS